MTRFRIIVITILTLSVNIIYTQTINSETKIEGNIVDFFSKKALNNIDVTLKDNVGNIIKSTVSDEQGFFKFNITKLGIYVLVFSSNTYKTFDMSLNIDNLSDNVYKVSPIRLIPNEEKLEEVTVIGKKAEVKYNIDGKLVTIDENNLSAGGLEDALNNIAGVTVENDGTIKVRGKDQVLLMIDGVQIQENANYFLSQIPLTTVKSVKVITNPSAKYSANGTNGIISISTKSNQQMGINLNVSNAAIIANNIRTNNAINVNYRRNKLNFFVNYGINHGINNTTLSIERPDIQSLELFDYKNLITSNLIKLGSDYFISDSINISIRTTQSFFDGKNTGFVNFSQGAINSNSTLKSNKDRYFQTYEASFRYKNKHLLDIDIKYSPNKNDEVNLNISESGDVLITNISNRTDSKFLNLDYSIPLHKKSKIEFGYEKELSDITVNNDIVSLTRFDYDYERDINSGYLIIANNFKKIDVSLGLRFENFNSNYIYNDLPFDYDYTELFPSAQIEYELNEKRKIIFNYARRVDRPSLKQIIPVTEWWNSSRVQSIGNPNLESQFSHLFDVKLDNSFRDNSFLRVALFYKYIDDPIIRTLRSGPNDTSVLSFDNMSKSYSYGVELMSKINIKDWWKMNAEFSLLKFVEEGLIESVPVKVNGDPPIAITIDNNFSFNDRLTMKLLGFYNSKVQGLQNEVQEYYKVDLGANYSILNKKGVISLRINDIFNTMRYKFVQSVPSSLIGNYNWESRNVFIGFNYNFMSGKLKSHKKRRREKYEYINTSF